MKFHGSGRAGFCQIESEISRAVSGGAGPRDLKLSRAQPRPVRWESLGPGWAEPREIRVSHEPGQQDQSRGIFTGPVTSQDQSVKDESTRGPTREKLAENSRDTVFSPYLSDCPRSGSVYVRQ